MMGEHGKKDRIQRQFGSAGQPSSFDTSDL